MGEGSGVAYKMADSINLFSAFLILSVNSEIIESIRTRLARDRIEITRVI